MAVTTTPKIGQFINTANCETILNTLLSLGVAERYGYECGGRLNSYQKYESGNLVKSSVYRYNHAGVRSKKTFGDVTADYYLDGSKLLGEDRSDGKTLRYIYDADGLSGVIYNGENHFYLKDALGNVVMICDSLLHVAARYYYDAHGKVISALAFSGGERVSQSESPGHIAFVNPFRWKSHYYDTETGLYMLNADGRTRYYDPDTGLFVDAESPGNIQFNTGLLNGLDRHAAVCDNIHSLTLRTDAIYPWLSLSRDPEFEWPAGAAEDKSWKWWHWLALGLGLGLTIASGGVLIAGAAGAIGMGTLAGAVAIGAASGTLAGAAAGAVLGAGIGYSLGGADGMWQGALFGFAGGAITGAISGGIAGAKKFMVAKSYLVSNNVPADLHKQIIASFNGKMSIRTVEANNVLYRYWGGKAKQLGHWVTPNIYSDPINSLALAYGNTAANMSRLTFNQTVQVLAGRAARVGMLSGGGIQYYLADLAWLSLL